jgi:hypothetical protein
VRARFILDGGRAYFAWCLLVPCLGGCWTTMDSITSQRFKDDPIHNMFGQEAPPLEVLRKSTIADERGKAMLTIKEPKTNGGTDAEQAEVLEILSKAATSDKQALVRMDAIEALGHWQDPRTTQIILMAYENAAIENPNDKPAPASAGVVQVGRRLPALGPVSGFTNEMIVTIRCRCLEALGNKQTPEALALLTKVALTPTPHVTKPTETEALIAGALIGQDLFDLRLAALRSMENCKGNMAVAQTLYRVMTVDNDHDVALKDRAYKSLKKVTGDSFAYDSPEWRKRLQLPEAPPAPAPGTPAAPLSAGSAPGSRPITNIPFPPTVVPGNPPVPPANGNVVPPPAAVPAYPAPGNGGLQPMIPPSNVPAPPVVPPAGTPVLPPSGMPVLPPADMPAVPPAGTPTLPPPVGPVSSSGFQASPPALNNGFRPTILPASQPIPGAAVPQPMAAPGGMSFQPVTAPSTQPMSGPAGAPAVMTPYNPVAAPPLPSPASAPAVITPYNPSTSYQPVVTPSVPAVSSGASYPTSLPPFTPSVSTPGFQPTLNSGAFQPIAPPR